MKKRSSTPNDFMSYGKQLEDDCWIHKVEEMKKNYKFCQSCRRSDKLQVHHKKYIEGRKVWEYDNEDLELLCERCHMDTHFTEEIPVYTQDGKLKYYTGFQNLMEICDKCDGEGIIPIYLHRDNGICYKCWGNKYFFRGKIT